MKTNRPATAQSLIEVTVGLVVLVPVLLVLLDLSIAFWAAQCNDTTCRNAAQAASAGSPIEATARAQNVLQDWNRGNKSKIVSAIDLAAPVAVQIQQSPQPQDDPRTGMQYNPGGPVSGNVSVTTRVEIRPFLIHLVAAGKPLCFSSTHSFPITYIQPPQ
jgi:hypothetical protein